MWGLSVTADKPVSGTDSMDEMIDASMQDDAESVDRKDGLILLVEDNELNREVINMQLSTLGYSSVVAADGREALELWKNKTFDLVLTDCHMPEMDGFELTQAIRKEELDVGDHVPIVAVTANTISEERDRCMDSGMDDVLTKPVDMEDLDRVINKWLSATNSKD